MLWMTGNGINIFTIMFTVMAMVNPVKAITGVNEGVHVELLNHECGLITGPTQLLSATRTVARST
jgi:hypothetical protein